MVFKMIMLLLAATATHIKTILSSKCVHCHLQHEVNTENPICKASKKNKNIKLDDTGSRRMSLCFQNRASKAAGGFTFCAAASVEGFAVSASASFCSWGMSAIAIQKRLQNDNADGCIHCHLQNEVNTENPICKALKNQKHQVR